MSYARFDALLGVDETFNAQRRRMMTSAMLAATVCMSAGMATWVGDKMGIAAVAPPKSIYEVSVQLFEAPPPPPPPRLPATAVDTDTSDPTPATTSKPITEPEPDDAPLEVAKIDLNAKPRRTTHGVPGPDGGGGGAGVGSLIGGPTGPGCMLPPCIGVTPPRTPRPTAVAPERAPIKAVMARAIYSPDPDPRKLALTPTGRNRSQSGRTKVSFCIDAKGKTYDIRATQRFPGDVQIDQICRQTVQKWRFRAMKVGGQARSTCTTVTFDIRFD